MQTDTSGIREGFWSVRSVKNVVPGVREALARLVGGLLDDSDVALIDLGSDPGRPGPVLRVHLRTTEALFRLGLPPEVDGVRVRAIVGDYRQLGRSSA